MSSPLPPPNPGAHLFPNLGAEEGPQWRQWENAAAPQAVRQSWRLLFAASAREVGADSQAPWPARLGRPATEPIFEGLENEGGLVPWLSTEEAQARARVERLDYGAANPESVAVVHDKAFAHGVAIRQRSLPVCLADCIHVLDPEHLEDPEHAIDTLRARLGQAPDWVASHFTLKPRWGSSGRGRVAGRNGQVDSAAIRGSLSRLAARGGALLEPWLDRTRDLSAHWFLEKHGPERLLGTLEQVVSAAGVCRGHRGAIDWRGRVVSDRPEDEALREASADAARAAREAGYSGPLCVDAFVFRAPGPAHREILRPLVEFNARFSVGIVALGLVRRALPWLREAQGLEPGTRKSFYVALDAPPGGWDQADRTITAPFERISLGGPPGGPEPCLVVCEASTDLDPIALRVREGG